MKRIFVEVMASREALARFGAAWRSAGKKAETTIAVGSMAELTTLLSPKRMELLGFIAENPGKSIRALSQALHRDYKNVHTDVSELEARHLLSRDGEGLVTAPYDEIVIRAPLRKAA
jgi:predicted transcriptional regulator